MQPFCKRGQYCICCLFHPLSLSRYSVVDSVGEDQDRAVDALLSMSDPDHVSTVVEPPPAAQPPVVRHSLSVLFLKISPTRHALADHANPTGRGVCAAVTPRGRRALCARSDGATAAPATTATAPPVPLCAAYDRSHCSATTTTTAAAGPRLVPAESPFATTGEGHHDGCAGPIQ
jgi:hypothetical protein